jgi:hypothetical protein
MKAVKTARYADPMRQKYPLDAYDDVVEANHYFDKYAAEFDPRTRAVMATNIYKRSCELSVPPGKKVRDHAISKFASDQTVRAHLHGRVTFYGPDTEPGRMYQGLMSKIGSIHPQAMLEVVNQLDAKYGGDYYWDSHIANPWDVVFTKVAESEAENNKVPAEYSYDFGTWSVSGTDLVRLAKQSPLVDTRFGHEFGELFRSDPIEFFDHLPKPEKEVLGRMARDVDSPG